MARGIDFGQAACGACGKDYTRRTPTSLYCSAACGYAARLANERAKSLNAAEDEGWKSHGVTHSGYSERRPAPEVIPVTSCPRCKRMAYRDGHALWCDGSPIEYEPIRQAPVVTRYTQTSYVEPAAKIQRFVEPVKATTAEVLRKLAAKAKAKPKAAKPAKVKAPPKTGAGSSDMRQPLPAQKCVECSATYTPYRANSIYCGDKCRRRAEFKRHHPNAKPRPKTFNTTGICQFAKCGGPIVGKKPGTLYCSLACCKNASHARRIGYKTPETATCKDCACTYKPNHPTQLRCKPCKVKAETAANLQYKRQRRLAERANEAAASTDPPKACPDCGETKPAPHFGQRQRGMGRMERCRICHGNLIRAWRQKSEVA